MFRVPVEKLIRWWPVLAAILISLVVLAGGYRLAFGETARQTSGRRLLGYGLLTSLFGMCLVLIILSMPVGDAMHGQLLGFIGILISGAIALSSTTLLGNAMAGVMLRAVGGFKVGDFVRVGEHFGRVTELALLHTEIQTENRDLTTLPNLFLVQAPVRVKNPDGTIVSAEVSIGYDVSRIMVQDAMLEAVEDAGLTDGFVRVESLGDYSIVYRASGLSTDVKRFLSIRSDLRTSVIDRLHARDIEIVSPTFQNQRVFDSSDTFLHQVRSSHEIVDTQISPESIIFDKADAAESREQILEAIDQADSRIKTLEGLHKNLKAVELQRQAAREIERLNELKAELNASLEKGGVPEPPLTENASG